MGHERRAFVSGAESVGSEVRLSDSDSKHLLQVLRCQDGDPVTIVSLETGREFAAEIGIRDGRAVALLKSEVARTAGDGAPESLAVGIIKGAGSELIVEKGVECGVKNIYFVETERSVVKIASPEDRNKKTARFLKIAEAAAKQSAQNFIPNIKILPSTAAYAEEMGRRTSGHRLFVCSLEARAKPLSRLAPLIGPFHIAVGPEGDFSPDEYKLLAQYGFESVSLGSSRLKSETAAIVASAKLSALRELNEVS